MFNKSTLKNGLTLVTAPKAGTKAVTVLVMLPCGSRYEQKNINGASHFLEHMMFKGTARRPTSLEITKELDAVGAEFNAFTAKDHTGYYVKIAADKAELAFDILSDMIFNSKIDEAELEKERGVILEEIKMYEDNPLMLIESLLEGTVFGSQPLGFQIAGEAAVIKKIERQQLLDYLKLHYTPANLHLTVAGNFREPMVKSLTAKYFNQPAISQSAKKFSKYRQLQTQPQLQLHFKATQQTQLCLGFPAYHYQHPEINALNLLAIILGGNMSSRLFLEIRERRGLAYFIHAAVNVYQDTGVFFIQAGLDKTRLEMAIELILAEMKKIKDFGVTAEELKDVKEFLAGKTILELEDSENLASWYGRQELLTGKILTPAERLAKVNQVKLAEIKKVANDIFEQKKLSLALIGPFKDKNKFRNLLTI